MPTSLRSVITAKVSAILESGIAGVVGAEEVGLGAMDQTIIQELGASGKVYFATRTLSPSTSEQLDLAGVLEDVYGNALTFTSVYAIAVRNIGTVASRIIYGPAASNGFGTASLVGGATSRISANINSGWNLHYNPAGYPVTAGTADLLEVENVSSVNSATYRILIVGI